MSIRDCNAEARLAADLGREVPTVYGFDKGTDEDVGTVTYMERLPDGAMVIVDVTHMTPAHQEMLRHGLERMRNDVNAALLVCPRLPGRKSIAALAAFIASKTVPVDLCSVPKQDAADAHQARMQQLRATVLGKKGRW